MEKKAEHLRKVPMPGRWKPPEPKGKAPGSTDFGFGTAAEKAKPDNKVGSLDHEYEYWKKNQEPANMDRLLRAAKPAISKALTSFAGGYKAMTARAKRLAIEAFKSYNPTRGAKLSTHLYIRLQPLQREYTERSSALAIPERVQLERHRLEQSERALSEELGREVYDSELAEYTGFSPKRMAHIRSFARGRLATSQLKTSEGEPMQLATEEVTPEDIWFEYVHYDLDPVDKKIIEWKTGMFNKRMLSTNEIARRLKITPSAVSQRAAKIALKLEEGRSA